MSIDFDFSNNIEEIMSSTLERLSPNAQKPSLSFTEGAAPETRAKEEVFENQRKVLESLSTRSVYVGALREKWTFCSDHLPVGTKVKEADKGSFHIGSWNVLNEAFMNWVEQDSQGLAGSKLIENHYKPSDVSGLTLREEECISLIIHMLTDQGAAKDILLLQECGWHFTIELIARLQREHPHIGVVKHTADYYVKDQNLILYNKDKFRFVSGDVSLFEFPESSEGRPRPFLTATLESQQSGRVYKIINVHLPGNPEKNAPEEFAEAIKRREDGDQVILAGGDMNFDERRVRVGFDKVFGRDQSQQYQQSASQYNTNITPKTWPEGALTSKCIDHIYFKDPKKEVTAEPLAYTEVSQDQSFVETLVALHTEA